MALRCLVCRHKDVDRINIELAEGIGTQQVAQDYGLDRASIEYHRRSNHGARELTRQVIEGHNRHLSHFAQISITSKEHRLKTLDTLLARVMEEIDLAPKGKLDSKLVKEARGVLETASKEMGEWRPDGGEKAEAATKLAQSIVIHAAVLDRKEFTNIKVLDVKNE